MGLLVCILVGTFIGWLVAAIKEVDEGVLSRMGVGLIGAVLGAVGAMIISNTAVFGHITVVGVLSSVIGAMLLLGISNRLFNSAEYNSSNQNPA